MKKKMAKLIRKISIGKDYKNDAMHYAVGQEVYGGHTICDILEKLRPDKPSGIQRYRDLIVFVEDRPGHDVRYAIDASKIQKELDWLPNESFESGISKTVQWYLSNESWWQQVLDGSYQGQRLGVI